MSYENLSNQLNEFLNSWQECAAKKTFIEFKDLLFTMQDIKIDFKARKGISYSLRAKHENQKDRDLFVMIDVIDDDPENRWLSICFYGDMIKDPEEKGDLIPGGLLGEDGYCFDLEEFTEKEVAYIKERITEAYNNAKGLEN